MDENDINGNPVGADNQIPTNTDSNAEKEIPLRVCLPSNKSNKESLYDGSSARTEIGEIGVTRQPDISGTATTNDNRNDSVCPLQVVSDGWDTPNTYFDNDNRDNLNFDSDEAIDRLSLKSWKNEGIDKLNKLRTQDNPKDFATPVPPMEGVDESSLKEIDQEECTQCTHYAGHLKERHYYTHVRSIIICDDEPLKQIDATHPRVIDTFTQRHAYQIAQWQRKNKEDGRKVIGRLPYWTTPYFLFFLLSTARHRLNKCFPFTVLNNTRYTWKETPVLISYTSKYGSHASITPADIFKTKAHRLPEPKHELVQMMSTPAQWMDGCFNVWIHVQVTLLAYPEELLTTAEDRFIKRIRQLIQNEENPEDIKNHLLAEFNTLREATTPLHTVIERLQIGNQNENQNQNDELKKSTARHAALKRALNFNLGKIKDPSLFSAGSPKQPSTHLEDASMQVQVHRKQKPKRPQTLQLGQTSPPHKKLLYLTPYPVDHVNKKQWKKSTNFLKKSTLTQVAMPSPNQNGGSISKGSQGKWRKRVISAKTPCTIQHQRYSNPAGQESYQLKNEDNNRYIEHKAQMDHIIATYPPYNQMASLKAMYNPHPRIRQQLRSKIRSLEWKAARGLLDYPLSNQIVSPHNSITGNRRPLFTKKKLEEMRRDKNNH